MRVLINLRIRWFIQCLILVLAWPVTSGYAIGPGNRVLPHRPNPPGPNNPIGPNNPAISNPLSPLNPATPFSNNQIVMRQLLSTQQSGVPTSGTGSKAVWNYGASQNRSFRNGLMYENRMPAGYRLLLNNRTVFSASHPLVLERPDPMTPLLNHYTVIDNRYYAISHDPANDAHLFHTWSPMLKTTLPVSQ